jgi:hypothetical protein
VSHDINDGGASAPPSLFVLVSSRVREGLPFPHHPIPFGSESRGAIATLHFICGKAASGKTTLARRLGADHRATVIVEDEWVTLLEIDRLIFDVADYARHTRRLRALIAPHTVQFLKLGAPVVFDFAGNTVKDRAWVRSVFEAAPGRSCVACDLVNR